MRERGGLLALGKQAQRKSLNYVRGDDLTSGANRTTGNREINTTRRVLILHDSFTFVVLTLVAAVLLGVTWLLFRSFATHRDDLAKEFAEQGRMQMQHGQPAQAVESLRVALGYAPDDYQSQLLLAQALADAGDLDQATNYFLNLWSARPGDGFLNLQLARLARRAGDKGQAITYYRASIFGDWRGDGSVRRRDVRLELVDYLIEKHDDAAARVELLIAAGNAPASLHLNALFADKLREAGDPDDALTYYGKAIADEPRDYAALEAAGRIVYGKGDYAKAHALLERAAEDEPRDAPRRAALLELAREANRLVELSLSRELPARERAEHLLEAARIAQTRLTGCAAEAQSSLLAGWHVAGEGKKRSALVTTAEGQDTLTQLIFQTERETARTCGSPTGDDALLLQLADGRQSGVAQQP